MESNILKLPAAVTNTFLVFRLKDKPPDSITADGLTVDIQDGSLIVAVNGVTVSIYGPTQWVSVNVAPI